MAKILILLNAVIVLGSAGLVYYSHKMIKRKPIDETAALNKMINDVANASKVTPVKLKKLTINLYSRKTRLRFLDIELNILPFAEKDKELIKEMEPYIADSVIIIAGDMTPEDLNSVSGKILLENKIRYQTNQMLKRSVVKEIFFSRFVIQ